MSLGPSQSTKVAKTDNTTVPSGALVLWRRAMDGSWVLDGTLIKRQQNKKAAK